MPLTPRELEVLDVVGEVMRERLLEVRREYEGQLTDLQTKVAALEARPVPKWPTPEELMSVFGNELDTRMRSAIQTRTTKEEVVELVQAGLTCSPFLAELEKVELGHDALIANVDQRFKSFVEPFNDRISALEGRTPEVTRKSLDDVEETLERRLAMLPPPTDLTALTEKIAELEARPVSHVTTDTLQGFITDCDKAVERRLAALPPPVDLTPLTERIAALEARPEPDIDTPLSALASTLGAQMQEHLAALPPPTPPVDLTPLTERIASLEARPPAPDHTDAFADLHERIAALPVPLTVDEVDKLAVAAVEATSTVVADLTHKVAALETQNTALQNVTVEVRKEMSAATALQIAAMDERLAALPVPLTEADVARLAANEVLPAVTDLKAKVAGLDERVAERATVSSLVGGLNDLEEKFETMLAALPPPADVAGPLAALNAELDMRLGVLSEAGNRDHADLGTLRERVLTLETQPPPPDLAPLIDAVTARVTKLEAQPSIEWVLQQAKTAVAEGQADIIARSEAAIEERFKALPIPEKGDKGEPGPGVTIEDFRMLFESGYANFERESERRIMELVQRTLDRVPVPKNGTDGVGIDDLNIVRDGRTIRHEYLRNGKVVKTFEFKTDELRYREVYKAGESYDRGDVVSWGGSIWIALTDTKAQPGLKNGAGADWRLAVKEGRRGRSAYDVAVGRGFAGTEAEWLASLKGSPGKDAKPARELTNGSMRGSNEP